MERQESRTVSTEVKIVLTEDEIIDILRAHVGLYEGNVVFWTGPCNGLLTQVEVTETHTEVVSTP